MATPALSGHAEVGKFYMVPCMKTMLTTTGWIASDGWVPVLGLKHCDAEHLRFPYEHYHIDWRFVGDRQFRNAEGPLSRSVLGSVLTNTHGSVMNHRIEGVPVLKRRLCKREMPEFPARAGEIDGGKWSSLERSHACNKLKPGNICPHRGIDLTPFIKDDGTVICPGHGLRWDTKTGDLLPHHARSA